jgi:hypothetical protein
MRQLPLSMNIDAIIDYMRTIIINLVSMTQLPYAGLLRSPISRYASKSRAIRVTHIYSDG